jgi:hypothetical protein
MSPPVRRPRLPWTQWRWDRWLRDPALRGCSLAARGLWIELLAAMDADDEYGFLTLAGRPADTPEMARRTGVHRLQVEKYLAELEGRGVFSRDERGAIFCRHMVREAERYASDVANGSLGGNPALRLKPRKQPRGTPQGIPPVAPPGSPPGSPQGLPQGSPPRSANGEPNQNNQMSGRGVNPDRDTDTDREKRRVQGGTQPALPLLRVVDGGGSPAAPGTPAQGPPTPARSGDSGKGSRIPENWQPDEACRTYAEDRGLDPVSVAEAFRDYWRAKAGKEARRVDWNATWRTWVRNEQDFRGRRGGAAPAPTGPRGGGPRDDNWQARRLARTRAAAGGGFDIEGEAE